MQVTCLCPTRNYLLLSFIKTHTEESLSVAASVLLSGVFISLCASIGLLSECDLLITLDSFCLARSVCVVFSHPDCVSLC